MPELPEVETVLSALKPAMEGLRLRALQLNRPDIRFLIPPALPQALSGQVMGHLQRRGKYILGFAESGAGFVLHLGMSGRIRIYRPDEVYAPEKHDHAVFILDNGGHIVFHDPRRFGFLDMVRREDWPHARHFAGMGPEPLGNAFNGPVLYESVKGRSAPIKTLLLDQKIVAGIGNIYASEALYRARVHPARAGRDISAAEADALALAIRAVLLEAIAAGGSTLKDYRQADGALGYFQHQFGVYDRAGLACPDCRCDTNRTGGVQKITQAGRSTFYCQTLQS